MTLFQFKSLFLCITIGLSLGTSLHLPTNILHPTQYPRAVTYVDKINAWWPASKIAEGLGVPGYAQNTFYNHIIFAFWTCQHGPVDIVHIWNDPIKYMGAESEFGNTKTGIQSKMKKLYNQRGIKIMISAFGAIQFPTTAGLNPIQSANKLGSFVLENNLDGVDIDWEDNPAMQLGIGQQWIIKFTKKLRLLLPNHIISHAPQAPYFKEDHYKNGAYVAIDREVGELIDFYNVQFYNQGQTKYDTYETLFLKSGGYFEGTSIKEISDRGVALNKLVVGKPVTQADASNTGVVSGTKLGSWTLKALFDMKWYAGVMYWQYSSDPDQKHIISALAGMQKTCMVFQFCL